jgi:hypothetical protein
MQWRFVAWQRLTCEFCVHCSCCLTGREYKIGEVVMVGQEGLINWLSFAADSWISVS